MGKLRVCSRRHLTGYRHCPSCGTVRWDHLFRNADYQRGIRSVLKSASTAARETPAVYIEKPELIARIVNWIKQIFNHLKGKNQ